MELKIKKNLLGEDDYRSISARLPLSIYEGIERLAGKANLSRNAIVVKILEYGLNHCVVVEEASEEWGSCPYRPNRCHSERL